LLNGLFLSMIFADFKMTFILLL